MPNSQHLINNRDFLLGLFGYPDRERVPVFALDGDPENWRGGWTVEPALNWPPEFPFKRVVNTYYCVSLFNGKGRRKSDFKCLRVIVLDDVGPKLDPQKVTDLLGLPTYRIETSPGNEQWGWRLAAPLEGPGAVDRFATWQRDVLLALLGPGARDPGHANVTRLVRLPHGWNTKSSVIAAHGGPFACRLVHWAEKIALMDFAEAEARVAVHLAADQARPGGESDMGQTGQAGQDGSEGGHENGSNFVPPLFDDLADDGFSPVAYQVEEIEDADELLGAFRDLDMVLSSHPRETSLGQRTWMVRCPWEDEHTARGDTGAAYAVGGAFKCHHGHCETRHIGELWQRMDELLGAESAGLDTLAVRGLGIVDPVTIAIPPALEEVARTQAKRRPAQAYVTDKLGVFWEGWGYLRDEDRFVRRRDGLTVSRVSFDADWMPVLGPKGLNVLPLVGAGKTAKPMTPSAWYLADTGKRLFLDGTTWEPGLGQIVRQVDGPLVRVLLNRWKTLPRPLELAPDNWVDEVAVAPWRDLVVHVLDGDMAAVELVLDWQALVVGAPGTKPGWHVLLIGGQGIGKEMIVRPLTILLGPDRSTTVSAGEIGSDFTGWICNRLILMPELRQTARGAPTGHDRYGMLKTLLDNAKPTLPVNPKYGKPFTARNVAAAWATSNEDRPLDLAKDDRRFWVHASQAKPWSGDAYARLVRWMELPAWEPDGPTGAERVCEYLLRRWETMPTTRKAVLTARAPMTQSKLDVIALGTDPWESFLRDGSDSLNALVTTLEVSRWMLHSQRAGESGLPPHLRLPTLEAIREMLKKMGAVLVAGGNQVRIPGGERSRVWATTETDKYLQMGSAEIAGAIAEMRKRSAHNNLLDDFGG